MIQKPEISVILSTYNRHRPQGTCPSLFERALLSILNQSFTHFELILIDDASTDGTLSLCQKYAAQDPRIKLIPHLKNSQLPARCYNEGIERSSGRYITFMFDDDVWLPNALTDLHAFLIANLQKNPQLGMIYGLAEFYDVKNDRLRDARFGREWDLRFLFEHNYLANCCVIIPREVIDVVGGYDEHPLLRRMCDWDLWQRIGRRYTVLRMNKVIAQVYQNQVDSVGVIFSWSPLKAGFYRLFRFRYPLKRKWAPWPQIFNYWKSTLVIYYPLKLENRLKRWKQTLLRKTKEVIKQALLAIGCWSLAKKIYNHLKT